MEHWIVPKACEVLGADNLQLNVSDFSTVGETNGLWMDHSSLRPEAIDILYILWYSSWFRHPTGAFCSSRSLFNTLQDFSRSIMFDLLSFSVSMGALLLFLNLELLNYCTYYHDRTSNCPQASIWQTRTIVSTEVCNAKQAASTKFYLQPLSSIKRLKSV